VIRTLLSQIHGKRRQTTFVAALGLLAAAALVPSAAANPASKSWLNAKESPSVRASQLLRELTLEEKIGQMDQIVVGNLRAPTAPANGICSGGNNDPLQTTCLQTVLANNKTGSILSGGSDNPVDNTGAGWANQYNTIQHYAIDNSRLHIPIIYGVDAVHGFGHPTEATLFPQQIGMGATWDTSLAEAAGVATKQQALATGGNWVFAPVQDISRDNRWGRYYETWAEAPALAGALGAANIEGLQGSGGYSKPEVAATVKHFAGYSQSLNGHDRAEAQLPIRYLQDTILPAYQQAIDAGASTVMVDSGSVNGIPADASHYLLTTQLRDRMHFQGVVISDYNDVPALASAYHIAPDLAGAIAAAVNAGVDMSMEVNDSAGWDAALLKDVQTGAVKKWRIDQAVRRILTLKFRLGLFDHPFVDPSKANAAVTANRDLARKAADESVTLLRNQNSTLPLSPNVGKLVVTGPSADSVTNQLGGWSVSWQGVFGGGQVCCAGPANQIPSATTVLAGIKNAVSPSTQVVYTQDQASAVSETSSADAAVVVVGENAYAEALGDDPSPQLKASQKALISALEATGKPVIVVVVAGRPLGLGPAETASALLMAYQPGTEGGSGVADVLFGSVNPSGKLPVTWPSDAPVQQSGFNSTGPSSLGDEPKFFDQLPGTNGGQGSGYNPLYPFGFGLSYTTFGTSGLTASTKHNTVTTTFTVTNTGSKSGADIVPVYVHQAISDPLVPNQRLAGFTRVQLNAGESKVVTVSFPTSVLALTPGDIDGTAAPRVPSGAYQARVGTLTADVTINH